MKRLCRIITIVGLLIGNIILSHAEQTIVLSIDGIDDFPVPTSPIGNRLPARRIVCTISDDGVEIDSSVADDGILSYEVWDEAGEICLAAYVDEHEFVAALAMFRGTYQLRFLTAEYALVGYISL